VLSDCASLNHLIRSVMDNCNEIHFMRDLTRGGLATVLNELSGMVGLSLEVNESSVPVDEPVKGVCEILGFDPLYLANEGKILIVAGINEHKKVLEILRSNPLGKNSEVIGEVLQGTRNKVILNTVVGGRRILEMPSGLQLPRIC
jgi:hydrogenase expression/formation protein HypE